MGECSLIDKELIVGQVANKTASHWQVSIEQRSIAGWATVQCSLSQVGSHWPMMMMGLSVELWCIFLGIKLNRLHFGRIGITSSRTVYSLPKFPEKFPQQPGAKWRRRSATSDQSG